LPGLFSAFAPDLVNTFTHRVRVMVSISIIRIMMVKLRVRVRSVVRVRGYRYMSVNSRVLGKSGLGRIWPDLGLQIRPGPGPNVLELEA